MSLTKNGNRPPLYSADSLQPIWTGDEHEQTDFSSTIYPYGQRGGGSPLLARATSLPDLAGSPKLRAFDFRGVRITGGILQPQIERTVEFYLSMPNDDILKGFRKRAGLPAPGDDLGGWCEHDSAVVFGQWLSGMARLYRVSADKQLSDKAILLMEEWGKCFAGDHKPYFSDSYAASHYPFDKTVCGLVDMHYYAVRPSHRGRLWR